MKTLFAGLCLTFLLIFTCTISEAQWTDSGSNLTTTDNVGIGTTSPTYPLNVKHPSFSTSSNGTNYKIGTYISIHDTYSIPTSVTESGYRMGLNVATHVNDPNFIGTLNQQYGMRIQYGTYTNSGAGTINNSYGLYLHALEGGNASIGNKYGIYQTGSNFKNYFQGYVGIGTNSPTEILSLYKYNDNVKIRLQNSATSWRIVNDVNAKFILNGQLSGDVFSIDDNNGRVGIGTISPSYKLDVSASYDGLDGLRINNSNSGSSTKSGINIKQGSNDMANIFARRSNNEFVFQNNQTVSTAGFTFLNGSNEDFRIDSNGNVGIGTTNPSNKLDVAGTIRGEEIEVEAAPWPDYVFSDTYKLSDLSEVSDYIEENHHLPGIPTAEEVEENGIKLGEMNAKLLEKIEELTLYLIEVKEEVQELRKENTKQNEIIENLQNQ